MKNLVVCCLSLAVLNFGTAVANAEDDSPQSRPVVVASFSGYAELKRDLEYLGALSGNTDLADELVRLWLPSTQGQALAGLDQARPWGASVRVTNNRA